MTLHKRFYPLAGLIGAELLFSLCAAAFFGLDPYSQNLGTALSPPDATHLLGTDRYGRDVLSRVVGGASYTVITALAVTLVAASFGTMLGLFCSSTRGKTASLILRIADAFLAFPSMILALAVASVLGGGIIPAALAICLASWPKYMRLAYSESFHLYGESYIEAAYMDGFTTVSLVTRQILPVVIGPLVVTAALHIGTVIIELSGLSFLGLGAVPPTPEWGAMLNESRNFLQQAPWLLFAPAAAVTATVALFQLLADTVRDIFDTSGES